jgi:hypothetical protein
MPVIAGQRHADLESMRAHERCLGPTGPTVGVGTAREYSNASSRSHLNGSQSVRLKSHETLSRRTGKSYGSEGQLEKSAAGLAGGRPGEGLR